MDTAGTDERALPWVHILADEVGARRPTSAAERRAAERVREELRVTGLSAQLEEFRGYATFAAPYALIIGLALAPVLLPRSRHLLRSLLAASATAALVTEGGLRHTPVSNVLSRRRSQNLVATIEPQGRRERTLCLVCHLDSSRSGLMFHPSVVGKLNAALNLFALAGVFQGAELFLARFRLGRRMLALSRLLLAAAGALLLERELLGQDVPGANDNASGVAVVSELARELVTAPLEFTRVVVLMTGCEESGLLGSQAFLRSRDTSSWLFVNFDNVGGPATLRYAKREGVAQKWDADTLLVAIAERTAAARPDLGLEPSEGPIGLTYDVTPVLARGGRGITFVAGDRGVIPNYHWPTDTPENLDPAALERAIEVGREMVAAIDRGEADQDAR